MELNSSSDVKLFDSIMFRRKTLVKVKDQGEEFEPGGFEVGKEGLGGNLLQSSQRFICSSHRFLSKLIWMHLLCIIRHCNHHKDSPPAHTSGFCSVWFGCTITWAVSGFWALCSPSRSLHCLSHTPTSQVSFQRIIWQMWSFWSISRFFFLIIWFSWFNSHVLIYVI